VWRPICDGALADELRAVAVEVAHALDRERYATPSLDAAAGAALCQFYVARATGERRDLAVAAEARLDEAVAQAFEQPLTEGLYSGITGVAWAIEHMRGGIGDDACGELDEALGSALQQDVWSERVDLVDGLAGIGVYLVERGSRPVARRALEHVVDRLSQLAVPLDDGVVWSTPLADAAVGGGRPFDLGVAHGVAGILAFLARAAAVECVRARALPLVAAAMRTLERQQLDGEGGVDFPYCAGERRAARSAWCYGAPGTAAAMLVAARAAEDPAWKRLAVAAGLAAAARAPTDARVADAGFCHGTAGLAHLFNRLYQASGDERFADAARFWLRRTLDSRRAGEGIAGFRVEERAPDGPRDVSAKLPTGVPGIALALAAAVSDVEPAWDRLFACS
jgi:class I lanthipeptide synthase